MIVKFCNMKYNITVTMVEILMNNFLRVDSVENQFKGLTNFKIVFEEDAN